MSSSGQRLLDQQQVELVELREPIGIAAGVGSVRIDLEQDVSEPLAHRADRLDVLAGLDLELDPAVAVGEVALDGAERSSTFSWMPTETPQSTSVRTAPRCSPKETPRARSSASRIAISSVPFAIGCPRTPSQRRRDVLSVDVVAREQSRQQVLANHVVGAADVLVRVERLAERDALAPALGVGADHAHEQDLALALGAE